MKRWEFNMEFAKRYVDEKMLRELLSYLSKDPVTHIERLLGLGKLLARGEEHKRSVAELEKAIASNPAVRQLAEGVLKEAHPNVLHRLLYNWFVNSALLGIPRQRQLSETLGFNVPHTILVDPTSACNLRCEGCWAGAYAKHDELCFERLDRLCVEAKELGIYWMVMSGGELSSAFPLPPPGRIWRRLPPTASWTFWRKKEPGTAGSFTTSPSAATPTRT